MIRTFTLPETSIWEKLGKSRSPVSFSLELTSRCNNECRHCYVAKPANHEESRAQELSINEISRIADEAVDLGALWCLLTGGEPLLRPDFEQVYLLLKRKGLLVTLFTNATLIRPEIVQLFKTYPPRRIEVSVYGATQETYERVTAKPGSFKNFRLGLDLLLQNNIPVRLKAMALRSNLHEFDKIAEFCRAHTGDYYYFDPFLNLRTDMDPVRNQMIIDERLTAQEVVALELSDAARLTELKKKCAGSGMGGSCGPECDHLFNCSIGVSDFYISSEGQFRLCICLTVPGMTCDVRSVHLREAWQILASGVRAMRSQNQEFLSKCKKCTIPDLCLWCPAIAFLETGVMDQWVDYFCQMAHARANTIRENA
jgi:radical SAM protein with 4Fe4S-binding SPASM domain